MSKKISRWLFVILLMGMLTGCGGSKIPENIETDSIVLNKDGSLEYYLTGTFDKPYYRLDELEQQAKQELDEFFKIHAAFKDQILLENVSKGMEDSSRVVLKYYFRNSSAFSEFYESQSLSVQELGEQQLDVTKPDMIRLIKDGSQLSMLELQQQKGKLLTTSFKGKIYCPWKIIGIGGEVSVDENGAADTAACEKDAYVYMK